MKKGLEIFFDEEIKELGKLNLGKDKKIPRKE
jgi:hypothetical protein